MHRICLTPVLVLLLSATCLADESLCSWSYGIATDQKQEPDLEKRFVRLQKALGAPLTTQYECKRNPVCCLWVTFWKPNPSGDGYLILVQPGGAILMASDLTQFERAIERIEAEAVRKANEVHLPVGVMTSYPVAALSPAK